MVFLPLFLIIPIIILLVLFKFLLPNLNFISKFLITIGVYLGVGFVVTAAIYYYAPAGSFNDLANVVLYVLVWPFLGLWDLLG